MSDGNTEVTHEGLSLNPACGWMSRLGFLDIFVVGPETPFVKTCRHWAMEREGAPVDPIGGSANATRSEIALPDGAVIELERTEFTARQDTVEAKVQDGTRYQGLLSREDYDKRKQRLGESLRAETDPEAYRREKLREAIEREDKARREADDARRRREEARKEKLRAELAVRKDGGVAKKGKKKKKTSANVLSFEEVDE